MRMAAPALTAVPSTSSWFRPLAGSNRGRSAVVIHDQRPVDCANPGTLAPGAIRSRDPGHAAHGSAHYPWWGWAVLTIRPPCLAGGGGFMIRRSRRARFQHPPIDTFWGLVARQFGPWCHHPSFAGLVGVVRSALVGVDWHPKQSATRAGGLCLSEASTLAGSLGRSCTSPADGTRVELQQPAVLQITPHIIYSPSCTHAGPTHPRPIQATP
ncbi:hypothetical protein BT67DRAFT_307440 [Trichocladium antarcticum]|uniref:Uncharacterized protein n=1 Tax=Trichocladium antarcticum TaxID=1450529 RepID=A0AAN6UJV0_9PEZI|nr:hypothetical protein BT67DRAFT_307440 [Trichocladium antarcticum]